MGKTEGDGGLTVGKHKWKAGFAAAAAALLLLAGCTQKEPAPPKETADPPEGEHPSGDLAPLKERVTVTIAEDGAASGAGFYIAKEKGYFEDYNIDVEFAQFANSDEMLPAVAAGEVDIAGGVSTASFFNAIAQGIDVRIIADKGHNVPGESYFTFVKGVDSGIEEYADIKGKKIAVSSRNSIDSYFFDKLLEHAGFTEEEVEFVLIADFGSMLGAVDNGTVDMALSIEPLIAQGVLQGMHERFRDATEFAPDTQVAMVLGSPQFMTQEKDISLRFMLAYLKGLRDYNDAFQKDEGKDEIIDIMVKHTALKDPKMWEQVQVTGLDPDGKMFVDNIREQYEHYKAAGAISGEIDFDKAIDTSITEEALEILGPYDRD